MNTDIVKLIYEKVLKGIPCLLKEGIVKEYNAAEKTINVLPEGEKAQVLGVRLQAVVEHEGGILIVPKVGSKVSILFFDSQEAVLHSTTEVDLYQISKVPKVAIQADEIIFNEGNFGGLLKGDLAKAELEKLNIIVNALLTIATGAPIPEAGNGSPSAFQAALQTALLGKIPADFSQIINPLIKQ